jgi:hypothetical protein
MYTRLSIFIFNNDLGFFINLNSINSKGYFAETDKRL